jgi:hypothetical protein
METTRVSNRLRAKRFKTGNATAEDKAYIEAKYGEVGYKPSGNTCRLTALKQKATVEQSSLKKKSSHIVFDSDEEFESNAENIKIGGSISNAKKTKAQAKFEEDMNKIVLEKERCETLMKEALEVKKPTLIIEEDEDNEVVEETFTQNDAIYLNSLIRDRTNKMRNLMSLDEEIERLEKKRANHVSKKCVEMTPERFRNALFELGYIKK